MFWRRGDDGDHDVGHLLCSIIKRAGLRQTAADRQPPRLQFGRQGKRVMTYRPDAAGAGVAAAVLPTRQQQQHVNVRRAHIFVTQTTRKIFGTLDRIG